MSATTPPDAIAIGNMRFLPHPDRPGVYVAGALELTSYYHEPTDATWWVAYFVGKEGRAAWGYGPSPTAALVNLEKDLQGAAARAALVAVGLHHRWQAADREARDLAGYRINLRTALFNEEPPHE